MNQKQTVETAEVAEDIEIKQGPYWHVHHDILIEWCYNYDERAIFIKKYKSTFEIETRLRLFKPVKGKLPDEVVQAMQAYDQAWQAYNQAEQAYDQARQACNQAKQACNQAGQAYYQAEQAYDQAKQAYNRALSNNKEAIEALHKEECLNCPWNGHTIFPYQSLK